MERVRGACQSPILILLAIVLPFPSTSGPAIHPLIESLAARIRQRRAQLPELSPFALDSVMESISGQIDGEELLISNELHRCRGLRKLHLEIARLGGGLQVLHCVFFPDPRFDLPIFGADIVAGPAGISAAIVDLSPVGLTMPVALLHGLESLPIPAFQQVRELPAWGSIFSPFVQFIRPASSQEESWFVDLADGYLKALISSVIDATPDASDAASTIQWHKSQLSYCIQQKRNDKTRGVLEKAFNPQWADRYIEEILFEDPPPL